MPQMKRLSYTLKEGTTGPDEAPAFLLMLNGNVCKAWRKGNWTVKQARMGAEVIYREAIEARGRLYVTYEDLTEVSPEVGDPGNTTVDDMRIIFNKAEAIQKAAKEFVYYPENWESYQELKTSNSPSIPVEFMELCQAVEDFYGEPEEAGTLPIERAKELGYDPPPLPSDIPF